MVIEIFRRGYAAGVREAVADARRVPNDSFPTEVRVLLDSKKRGEG